LSRSSPLAGTRLGGHATRLLQAWPGVGLAAVCGFAASTVAAAHGGPPLLYALLLGMSLASLAGAGAAAGIEFCARGLLRVGIALLGLRITLAQIGELGAPTLLAVTAAVVLTIGAGIVLARRLGLPPLHGLVAGVATAICGASAALAVAAVLPREREHERFTLITITAVTALSTAAMLVYPLLAHALGLGAQRAGVFIGASIHDVAQVVGAGYTLGTAAGETAVVVKLFRVSLLGVVVIAVAAALQRRGTAQAPRLPAFIAAFIGLALLNSVHLVPAPVQQAGGELSRGCLVTAIAAIGLKSDWCAFAGAGWRPLALLVGLAVWLASLALIAAWL
jgi:uncharacterized integral membrane protein (TIGR00698 family)